MNEWINKWMINMDDMMMMMNKWINEWWMMMIWMMNEYQ